MTLEDFYNCVPSYIEIDYHMFKNTESLSAPFGEGFVVAIDPTKVRSSADEKLKAAHEVGHCETGAFYSQGENFLIRQRYENKAERWAIKKLVPKDELEQAVKNGNTEVWQLAEWFDVPDQFIQKAISYYNNI